MITNNENNIEENQMINGVKRNCIQERYCGISNQHINQERKKRNSTTVDADNENQYKSLSRN